MFIPFAFFEFAKIGVILFVAGIAYYALIGKKFLPDSKVDCDMEGEVATPKRPEKMWWSLLIFAFVVVAMATKMMPLVTAAMLGACLVVATRCMTMKEAFKSIDWTTIFLSRRYAFHVYGHENIPVRPLLFADSVGQNGFQSVHSAGVSAVGSQPWSPTSCPTRPPQL